MRRSNKPTPHELELARKILDSFFTITTEGDYQKLVEALKDSMISKIAQVLVNDRKASKP